MAGKNTSPRPVTLHGKRPAGGGSDQDHDWLRQWHILCCSYGLLKSTPEIIIPTAGSDPDASSPPTSQTSASPSSPSPPIDEVPRRVAPPPDPVAADLGLSSSSNRDIFRRVAVHHYCLSSCLRLLSENPCTLVNPYVAKEKSVVIWDLPRWTGRGPWVREGRTGYQLAQGGWGFWRGTQSQRDRWEASGGAEGSHIVQSDLTSPAVIPPPHPSPWRAHPRKSFPLSRFEALPTTILCQIAMHLIPPETTARPPAMLPRDGSAWPICPESDAQDLLALLRTCTTFRHLPLPVNLWENLALSALQWYFDALALPLMTHWANRCRRNQMYYGMEGEFGALLVDTLYCARANQKRLKSEEWASFISQDEQVSNEGMRERRDELEYTTKDVFYWFTYHEAWRSRRRVWYAVRHGISIARQSAWR